MHGARSEIGISVIGWTGADSSLFAFLSKQREPEEGSREVDSGRAEEMKEQEKERAEKNQGGTKGILIEKGTRSPRLRMSHINFGLGQGSCWHFSTFLRFPPSNILLVHSFSGPGYV
jgi:hypothetical protein